MVCDDEGSIPSRPPTEISTPTKEVDIMSMYVDYATQMEFVAMVGALPPTGRKCAKCKCITLELDETLCAACLSDFYVVTDTRTTW